MRLDTLGLEAFVAIAEQGGFRKAAQAVHITQTALSRRLQNLESLLDVTLVERTTRSVSLTPIGRNFLPQARRILTELNTALVELRETGKAQRGDFAIACVPTVGVQYLPRILQEYSATHPQNHIKILDHASLGVSDAVLRREAEFGIQIAGAQHPDLATETLLEDRFVLVCRSDHPLARRARLPWKELESHALILAGDVSGNRPLLEEGLRPQTVALRSLYEVQRSSTALGLVNEGVGAAVVPSLALQKGAYPRLRVIALTHPVISRTLVLVARRGAVLSPAAQALYDLIRRRASP
jgi:DNA-binding transcriptional LysR family regulator